MIWLSETSSILFKSVRLFRIFIEELYCQIPEERENDFLKIQHKLFDGVVEGQLQALAFFLTVFVPLSKNATFVRHECRFET